MLLNTLNYFVRGIHMRLPISFVLVVLAIVVVVLPHRSAQAAEFTVDSTTDAVDAILGDGVCATAAGECTLRAAIQEANTTPELDFIALPAGTYRLTIDGADEDAGATGDLDINAPLTITGAGADQTILDANGLDRVIHVLVAGPDVTLTELTVRGGVVSAGEQGGGVWMAGAGSLTLERVVVENNRAIVGGGGISSRGPLVIREAIIAGNAADGFGGGVLGNEDVTIFDSRIENNSGGGGAGIQVQDHVLTIERSSVTGNLADTDGGGIGVFRNGVLHATNVTVSNNRVELAGNIAGVRVDGSGNQLRHVTIANNVNGPGLAGFSADITVSDSIISGHAAGDCRSGGLAITAVGVNLDSDGTCGFSMTGDPGLAPLAYWGGPDGMLTHALGSLSPAIDAAAGCIAVDQRGVDRPQGAGCDLGAYEATPAEAVAVEYPSGFSTLGWVGGAVTVQEAFGDVLDQLEAVFAWDALKKQFLSWSPSLPNALNTLRTLAPGTGLWIQLRDGGTLATPTLGTGDAFLTGDAYGAVVVPSEQLAEGGNCVAPKVSLEADFNLVAWEGGTTPADAAFGGLGAAFLGAWVWNAAEEGYRTFNPSLPPALNTLTEIGAGQSIWLRLSTATVLTGVPAC